MTTMLLSLFWAEFDDKYLDAKITYIGLTLDSDSDPSSSDSDKGTDKAALTKKNKIPFKKVTFEKMVPAAPIVEPISLSPVG
jgi:hypothetical protein